MISLFLPARLFAALSGFAFLISPAEAQDFDTWKASFRINALAAGISPATWDREMASVTPVPRVLELNTNQPEFSRSIWTYLDGAVSDARVRNGLKFRAANTTLLDQIEAAYGVDAETIVAIWGLESSYGAIQGNYDALSALATLAHEGRRITYGRSQLLGALKILDKGYASRAQLKGSWAGAMGQTQFIPTTYLDYAIDYDGDGQRNLWADKGDVFASTANYLSRSGYTANEPWGFEVTLPAGFNYASADKSVRKPVAVWASMGLSRADGTSLTKGLDLNARSWLIVPAGAKGPTFMVFDNFKAILRYNNSTSYALGIGLLSDKIAGRAKSISAPWPRDDRALSFTERKTLQEVLTAKGYRPGPVDGIIGAGTRSALRQWQSDNNLPADGYASAKILQRLQG